MLSQTAATHSTCRRWSKNAAKGAAAETGEKTDVETAARVRATRTNTIAVWTALGCCWTLSDGFGQHGAAGGDEKNGNIVFMAVQIAKQKLVLQKERTIKYRNCNF